MSSKVIRARSKAEVVFMLMRALLAGRLLWGADGRLSLSSLKALVGAPPHQIARALVYLSREGIVWVDRRGDVVRLTERGMCELVAPPTASNHLPPYAAKLITLCDASQPSTATGP